MNDFEQRLQELYEYAEENIFKPHYPEVVWIMRQEQFDQMVEDGTIRWVLGPEEW